MARDAAPPAIPWLVFSPSYGDESSTRLAYRLEDGAVMRIPLPSEALNGKRVVGADDGGWVAACGDMQLIVMNLFSGVEVTLPANDTRTICLDIGRLYGLTRIKELIKFEIGVNKHGGLVVTWEHKQPIRIGRGIAPCLNYIVDLHGKLAMLERTWSSNGIRRGPLWKVFKLVDDSTSKDALKWEEIMSLGDHALFFGEMWSKMVYVSATGRSGVQANYVYADDMALTYLCGHDDHVFLTLDESTGDVMPEIKSAGSIIVPHASTGTWILPPDF
uniref:KIB1-4 beta-propeller domain-containing protein n=1 Tax=Aegilops tauschii TaxID=37682 RepID=M8CLF6_AEGTA